MIYYCPYDHKDVQVDDGVCPECGKAVFESMRKYDPFPSPPWIVPDGELISSTTQVKLSTSFKEIL